jgi:hypothetical protein
LLCNKNILFLPENSELLLFLVARRDGKQGCQILIDTIYQNGEKSIQSPQKLPNEHKIYQMAIKYSKLA